MIWITFNFRIRTSDDDPWMSPVNMNDLIFCTDSMWTSFQDAIMLVWASSKKMSSIRLLIVRRWRVPYKYRRRRNRRKRHRSSDRFQETHLWSKCVDGLCERHFFREDRRSDSELAHESSRRGRRLRRENIVRLWFPVISVVLIANVA